MAFGPDGRWVHVGAGDGARVDVIDVAAHKVVASVPVSRRPWGVAVR